MRTAALAAALLMLAGVPRTADAQLLTAKDAPVVFGHYHLHVASIDEHKKFWGDALGGRPIKVGPLEAVAFPNVFVFVQQAKPEAPKVTTIDHIAFQVADLKAVIARLKAGGFTLATKENVATQYQIADDIASMPDEHMSAAFVVGPDGAKVELFERRNVAQQPVTGAAPITFSHVHFQAQDYTAIRKWYSDTFGAKPGNQTFLYKGLDLPGLPGALQFSRMNRAAFTIMGSPMPFSTPAGQPAMPPTKNQVVDHIGFEVRGLEAFIQQFEKNGGKMDLAYRKIPAMGLSIAFLTDPWGTYIELTEGLNAIP